MTAAIGLAPRLDLPAATPLVQAILAQRGHDLTIDAGQVTHLGALCVQVLACAARTWAADGKALRIPSRSADFDGALALFGLTAQDLQSESSA